MAEPVAESGHDPLRIVVFTNIPGGVVYTLVAEAMHPLGHRIVGVVTTPGPPRRRSTSYLEVVAAVPPSIDVLVSNHPSRLAAMLAPLEPDLIITGGFPWLIPEGVINLPRLGTINMHPAALPKYRGPCSVEWALRNGDRELGLTVHRMAGAFDTGAILAQGSLPIHDDDMFPDISARFGATVPELLRTAVERVVRGEAGEDQDETQASYAGLFEPEWRQIDWNRPARTIHNQVRSWTGNRDMPHGAIGQLEGESVQVTRTRLLPPQDGRSAADVPGSVLVREEERLVVQCGDGPLELIAWRRADDSAPPA